MARKIRAREVLRLKSVEGPVAERKHPHLPHPEAQRPRRARGR